MNPFSKEKVQQAVNKQRLIDTALALIEIPSPTRSAGAVADRLAQLLEEDGFEIERPVADWPNAPAVVARLNTGKPGPILQLDGHLDTVHLPFVPARHENGCLYGSGAADMKGGVAASVEALRVLRETKALTAGGILFTAHDHHEGPWGDRRQLRALIREGTVGDAVLLPEYSPIAAPIAGRGMFIFEIRIQRDGEPIHEVFRKPGLPDVLGTGARLVSHFLELHEELKKKTHPLAGHDSIFVGQIHAGEIYNQAPTQCVINGTRRWIIPGSVAEVEADFRKILDEFARDSGTKIECDIEVQGDAFQVDPECELFKAFQNAYKACYGNSPELGAKPYVDDGNTFYAMANIPALTHGPAATGAHTLDECCPVDELVRVAEVYALTAMEFCV